MPFVFALAGFILTLVEDPSELLKAAMVALVVLAFFFTVVWFWGFAEGRRWSGRQ